jgi:uncharacterized protein (DUF58 family)
MRPPAVTGRLVAAAVAASLVALVMPFPVAMTLLLLNGALIAIALVDAGLATRPAAIGVERDLPAIVPLHGKAAISWRLRNPTGKAIHATMADQLAPSLGSGSRRARLTIPAHGHASASTTIRPTRRGRFTPTEVVVRVEGPLRLGARQGVVRVPGTLRVYPPFRSRQEAELRMDRARILEVGLRSAKGRGGGTDFDSLREYGVDDEFRRIDWASTARAGKPIVRTYRAEQNQTVLMLLDAGRTMAGRVALPGAPPGDPSEAPRLDHAMDAVMMLTAVATRLGDRTGLVAFDDQVRAVVPPSNARDALSRVTEAMFDLHPALAESDYRGAFAQALARFRRRNLLVVFTELADEAATETLIPALPLIARSHLVMIASVTDPQVAAWARATPADAGGAYRKAAAIAALTRRRATVAKLRSLGATVIDATPGDLAPQLADAYLKVKATARL